MEVESDFLTQDSPQDMQGNVFQSYFARDVKAGDVLSFTVTGEPKSASTETDTASDQNKNLLIGAGGLGLLLIVAGAWMYLRDRNRVDEDEEDEEAEEEFESSEDVMDAIIALDDLYRAKKISEEAYQKRRAELKEVLKEMA